MTQTGRVRSPSEKGLLLKSSLPVEVILCGLSHNGAQRDDADQVGNRHKTVQGVSDVPGDVQFHHRTNNNDESEDDLIDPVSYTHLTLPTTPYV